MTFARGRFAPSAEHGKAGMTVLVPRPVVDAEQRELMSFLTSAKVQNLIIFLRRGGVRHLDINERLGKAHGEYQGYAPLHVAALTGTSSVVSALLELGSADPDVLSVRFLETPLHLAAKKGDVGMTRALLTAGARPDSKDKQGLTPLLVAASSSTMSKNSFHHLVASELVKGGASIVARNGSGDTALHLACDTVLALPLVHEIVLAAKSRNRGGLGEAVEALNVAGEGVLHRACATQQTEVAKLLLEAGARSDSRSSSGDTAMHCAARSGLEGIAAMLIELSPGDLALNASNIAGETPLHLAMSASSAKHARVARMLLARGAFAFGRTRNGETVLHACAREGNTSLAALILSRPSTPSTAEALNAKANNGGTPLHVAVAHNQDEMVKLLLAQSGTDRGATDIEGNTPIILACTRGMCAALLTRPPLTPSPLTPSLLTRPPLTPSPLTPSLLTLSPLTPSLLTRSPRPSCALFSGDIVLLQRLLRSGRGVGARELKVRNALGWTALHASAFRGQDVAVRMLLRFQAPVDQKTADGWTALHLASSEGNLSAVTSLLAAGAQLDAHHASGESALGLAAARGHSKVVTQLLKAGAAPGAQSDEHGWTPFHAALSHGDADVALLMLEKGGRVRSKHSAEVGDPIDLAHPAIRGRLLEAEENRRRLNRIEGRDSDDGGEWDIAIPPEDPPMPQWPAPPEKKVTLLLPEQPYMPEASHVREDMGRRSGYFGYHGDPLLYTAHRQPLDL